MIVHDGHASSRKKIIWKRLLSSALRIAWLCCRRGTQHMGRIFLSPLFLEQRKQRQTPRSPNLEDPEPLEIAFHHRFTLSHCEFLGKDPDSCHCTRLPSPSRSQNLKRENIIVFPLPPSATKAKDEKVKEILYPVNSNNRFLLVLTS